MAIAQSSHLQEHQYDPNTQVLTIRFTNGAIYQYTGVPLNVANGLAKAGGGGTFFWKNIRYQYPTTKIVDPRGP